MTEPSAAAPGARKVGFNKVYRDLDRLIAMARLSGTQSFLVQRAREASYALSQMARVEGDPEPAPFAFRLNKLRLAAILGVDRSVVSKAHGRLVAARIFVASPDAPGFYLINKDAASWLSEDGSPLLTPEQVREAGSARELNRGSVAGWAEVAAPGCARTSRSSATHGARTSRSVGQKHHTHRDENITRPYRGTGASERVLESLERAAAAGATIRATDNPIPTRSSPAAFAADDYEPISPPSLPPSSPRGGPPAATIVNRPPAVTPIANDPSRTEAVVALARAKWGTDAADRVRECCETPLFWAEDVDAAVRKASGLGKGWNYANAILCQWWSETGGRRKHPPGGPRASAPREAAETPEQREARARRAAHSKAQRERKMAEFAAGLKLPQAS